MHGRRAYQRWRTVRPAQGEFWRILHAGWTDPTGVKSQNACTRPGYSTIYPTDLWQ